MRLLRSLMLALTLAGSGCSWERADARACTPPRQSWGKPHPHLGPKVARFAVAADHDGNLYLEGRKVSVGDLSAELKKIRFFGHPSPAVSLETEMGAPCRVIEQIRSLMEQQLACTTTGHCDEGAQSVWSKLTYSGTGVP
jgi:hypothetical protein